MDVYLFVLFYSVLGFYDSGEDFLFENCGEPQEG